jgi:hypothetical protein
VREPDAGVKTDAGRRKINLDPATVAALRAHRKRQAEERLALGPAYDDSGLVVCREDGTSFWPQSFSRMFNRHVRAAGIQRIPLKNLRHTHATLLLANGVPAKGAAWSLQHLNHPGHLRERDSGAPRGGDGEGCGADRRLGAGHPKRASGLAQSSPQRGCPALPLCFHAEAIALAAGQTYSRPSFSRSIKSRSRSSIGASYGTRGDLREVAFLPQCLFRIRRGSHRPSPLFSYLA